MGVLMLLDTHIFLWWLFDDKRLSASLRERIADPEQRILVSAASVWEISIKFRIGKLPGAAEVAHDTPVWITKAGFEPLSILPVHAQLAGSWDIPHRDPFDRMLAAQAKLEELSLASVDPAMGLFGIDILR
jgi:PIN domain nuclease of toxin-antitoxin system